IRRLPGRWQRAERVQRESAANTSLDSARMKDDRLRLENRRGNFGDRAVADGDQNQLRFARQLVDAALLCVEARGDRTVETQGDAGERPADPPPCRAECPGGATAADDAEGQ